MPNGKTNCFVDTNILVYAIDERSPAKRERAALWLRELGLRQAIVLSPQSLNEFYSVACRRLGVPRGQSLRSRVWRLSQWCVAPVDVDLCREAWLIEDQTGFQYWDCLLLASASRAGCQVFLSEDLGHRREVGRLTIINPFETEPATLLAPL